MALTDYEKILASCLQKGDKIRIAEMSGMNKQTVSEVIRGRYKNAKVWKAVIQIVKEHEELEAEKKEIAQRIMSARNDSK